MSERPSKPAKEWTGAELAWWETRATYALCGDAEATRECLEGVVQMLDEIRRLRRIVRRRAHAVVEARAG